jgi:hypothetical protein
MESFAALCLAVPHFAIRHHVTNEIHRVRLRRVIPSLACKSFPNSGLVNCEPARGPCSNSAAKPVTDRLPHVRTRFVAALRTHIHLHPRSPDTSCLQHTCDHHRHPHIHICDRSRSAVRNPATARPSGEHDHRHPGEAQREATAFGHQQRQDAFQVQGRAPL